MIIVTIMVMMMDTMMGMMMDVMTMIMMTTTNFDRVIVCFVIFPYFYGECIKPYMFYILYFDPQSFLLTE